MNAELRSLILLGVLSEDHCAPPMLRSSDFTNKETALICAAQPQRYQRPIAVCSTQNVLAGGSMHPHRPRILPVLLRLATLIGGLPAHTRAATPGAIAAP